MKSYFILTLCFIFLVQYFVDSYWMQIVLASMALIAFFTSITLARRMTGIFSLMMFTGGVVLTFVQGHSLKVAADNLTSNIPLLTLLALVPLLSIPFKMGGFFDSILTYLKRLRNNPIRMFSGTTAVLFMLGPILNLGALRLVHDLLKDLKLKSTMLSKAYIVGFTSTILWSPYYAAVGITLLILNVSIGSYMAYGIGIAIVLLIIGNVLFVFWSRKQRDLVEDNEPVAEWIPDEHRRRIKLLPIMIMSLMVVTITAEYITSWSMLVLVSLLSILFPLVWVLFTRKWNELKGHLIDYRDKSVPILNNEIVMYLSAGFFGNSLRGTTFGENISLFMTDLAQISFMLFMLFILVTMVSVTFFGIHQIVVVTVLATQMDPVLLGTSKEMLAMVIMLSWTAGAVLAPVSPINILVGNLLNKTTMQIGFRDNGKYVLLFCVIGFALLAWMNGFK